jgi:transcriptional regulator of arginine metabolism
LANKRERHATIRQIVESRAVSSQESLRKLLRHRGWDVTQSTLSRDLHEMGLARIPTADGVRYAFPELGEEGGSASATLEVVLPPLFRRLDGVGELIVLRTATGGAQPVAVALDAEDIPDVLGTVAGDDTILIICRSGKARERLSRLLSSMAASGRG